MIAFLNRRWVLLSCVVLLATLSVFTLSYSRKERGFRAVGINKGNLFYFQIPDDPTYRIVIDDVGFVWESHRPAFGKLPKIEYYGALEISAPLWLLLSAVLGWLVIRELRFREKRAKAAETITP